MRISIRLPLVLLLAACGGEPVADPAAVSAGAFDVTARQAVVYMTAAGTGHRLTAVDTLGFGAAESTTEAKVYVFVDPTKTFQSYLGIGGALTDASAETLAKLPEAQQEEVL